MCLAVPGKIIAITCEYPLRMADVDFFGSRRSICIHAVDASVGDFIIAHAGVAISVIDADDAKQTIVHLIKMSNYGD